MGSVILGTGSCLPKKILSNNDLEKIVETSDEWISTRTGIKNRRIGSGDEYTYKLSTEAAKVALERAGVAPEELDLIVVGTITSHMLMPSTACFVQNELGAVNAFAYDLNAACSGFLYGLDLADKYVRANHDSKILVIGAETLSTRVNWEDRNTCILFGDGAGAAVVGYSDDDRGYMGSQLYADGGLWKLLHMHAPKSNNPELVVPDNPGPLIIMEGTDVFKYAVKAMSGAVNTVLDKLDMTADDVHLVIPHQANIRIINKLKERLKLSDDKVFVNVADYGNTSAASIPIAIDEAFCSGRMKAGDNILLCSFGGGFTWGAALIKW